jgi:hypothetical protein
LKELSPHPKLLFNYLKALMNIRSHGLDDSHAEFEGDVPLAQQAGAGPSSEGSGHVRERDEDHSLLDSQVHLADFLQRSGLEFTDEMAETFVEVRCFVVW